MLHDSMVKHLQKKSIALADPGRVLVGPTSSLKGCMASNVTEAGVSLLEPLCGTGPFFQPRTVGVVVVEISTEEVTGFPLLVSSTAPRPLSRWLWPLPLPIIAATGEADQSGETGLSGKRELSGETDLSGKTDLYGDLELSGKKVLSGETDLLGKTGLSGETILEMSTSISGDGEIGLLNEFVDWEGSSQNCTTSALVGRHLLFDTLEDRALVS